MRNNHSLKASLFIYITLALVIFTGCNPKDDGDSLYPQIIDGNPSSGQKILPEGPITIAIEQESDDNIYSKAVDFFG